MKTTQHARTPLLLLLAFTGIASAQLKVGSNPETIAGTSNFEVESTNGTKTVIDKTTGNLGIGTTTPASTLSVNGSFATNYTSVTANAYTLAVADSIVAWSGSAAGTLTLPAAVSGTGNFKGRTYTVKNTSGSYEVTVTAPGSEKIDANSTYPISPGASASFVSTGATSGATWTAVGQSSSAVTTFSGGYVSGVDLSGLPTATVEASVTNNVATTVSTSQVTTAMNSLPSSGGVVVIKFNGTATHATLALSTSTFITIGLPTNVAGRKFYLVLDFSNAFISLPSSSGNFYVSLSPTSRILSPTAQLTSGATDFYLIYFPGGTTQIKSAPIVSFTGTTAGYWLMDSVGSVAY